MVIKMAEAKKTTAKKTTKTQVAKEQEQPVNEQQPNEQQEPQIQRELLTVPEAKPVENAGTQLDESAHEHAQRSASSVASDEVRGRWTQAKAVLYTDGLSGHAEQNLERAYEFNERLQSNNPDVRRAGDNSLSESALDARDERDTREAQQVIDGQRF